jgi:DNA-binding MarR family transcriptional regulator
MDSKKIGIILIISAVIIASIVYIIKLREDAAINLIIEERDSCFLDDGTCLHAERDYTPYIVVWLVALSTCLIGIYLIFLDKTQKTLAEQQIKLASALNKAKKQEKEKDEFKAFLAGFNEDEQNVIRAIREQEGIQQSTLRFRTGMSKTSLSLMLKSLEKRDIITRKEKGKTNQIFLRKKF